MSELPIIQWPGGRPPVPSGPITAPEAWYADEMADSSLWLYQLSEGDVSEINRALDGMEAASRAMTEAQQKAHSEAQANARRFAAESTRLVEAALTWQRELGAAGLEQALDAARRGVERLRPEARP